MTMIAYVGPDISHDLLAATGRDAGPVGWNIDRPTPAADRWLESKFPLWARSIVQDWADGAFDHLDAILFARADDSAQRLYYYLTELQRQGQIDGPEPMVLEIATVPRASSVDHNRKAVATLAARLDVTGDRLEQAIVATNARRATSRAATPSGWPVALLAGSAPPDRRLHRMVEASGWGVAGETLLDAWQRLGPPVDEASGDPFAALARQLHACTQGARAFIDHEAKMLADVRAAGARAAILWFAEEEEALVWHLPMQRRALADAGVPTLVLTRRDWRGDDGVEREIATFLQGLGA